MSMELKIVQTIFYNYKSGNNIEIRIDDLTRHNADSKSRSKVCNLQGCEQAEEISKKKVIEREKDWSEVDLDRNLVKAVSWSVILVPAYVKTNSKLESSKIEHCDKMHRLF